MEPLPLTFPYFLLFWPLFLWAFIPEYQLVQRARKSANKTGSRDAGSLRVISRGVCVGITIAPILAWIPILRVQPALEALAFGFGLVLLVGGSLVRRHCWRMLGANFTGDVRVHEAQPVVERGAYRWVRHPSYSAGAFMTLGLGLALGSWASALVLVTTALVVFHYRMKIEEQALSEALGERYQSYIKGRKRLIPFFY